MKTASFSLLIALLTVPAFAEEKLYTPTAEECRNDGNVPEGEFCNEYRVGKLVASYRMRIAEDQVTDEMRERGYAIRNKDGTLK